MNAAPITVAELCRQLGTEAPPALADFAIHGIAPLDAASATDASFVVRAKAAKDAATTKAGVVFVPRGSEGLHAAAVPVPEVWAAVLALLRHFHPEPAPVADIHDSAVVDKRAEIGAQVSIGPGATIAAGAVLRDRCRIGAQCHVGAGAYIGEDTVLHPRVTVLDRCRIGQRVILHSGVVVGSDGYKYEVVGKRLQKIPQVGIVAIEDDVEIGANTTIDRASFAATKIGARTKIDNLVQIGHNVEIGSDCLIVAQVGIAGSAKIGRGVILAGQAGVRDNVTIGDGSRVGGQSGIQGDLPPRSDVMGSPAIPAKDFARVLYVTRKLPELYRALKGAGFSSSTEE